MSNAVNLTDGLDGLAGGTASIAFLAMAIAVLPVYPGSILVAHMFLFCSDWKLSCVSALAVFGIAFSGACVGFLVHNRPKASVFMGDTGSLALGGALAAMASVSGMFLPLFIASFVFVVETVSVVLQVCLSRISHLLSKKQVKQLFV